MSFLRPRIFLLLLVTILGAFHSAHAVPQPQRQNGLLQRLRGGAATGGAATGGATGGNTGGATGATSPTVCGNGATASQTAFDGAQVFPNGMAILNKTATIDGFALSYRIAAPVNQFTAQSGVTGATAPAGTVGTMGMNVLLHGDGGDSFFAFPNQIPQNNLMGVVILSPNSPDCKWGGGSGLQRTDGAAHSKAVNDLIQTELPNQVAFNKDQVFFTGVSGGSLTLSGFFIPQFMAQYNTGVMLNCGALTPQVAAVQPEVFMNRSVIHFQSTQQELSELQGAYPAAIQAYETLATNAGLSTAQINSQFTVDNSPNGGHCAFDGQDFTSGVQLMADNYATVIQAGGTGVVNGLGGTGQSVNVKKGIVGNENLQFSGAAQK